MEAIESLPRYRHRGYFQAWLFSIARHRAANFHTRRPAEDAIEEGGLPGPPADDPLLSVVQGDELQQLNMHFQLLDDDEQEVLRLRYVAELSYAEIGAVLKRSEGAVKKQTYRLLARLKSQLENDHA
jgi:RNA polymerase sigma-70 factor (ECF subfamily)